MIPYTKAPVRYWTPGTIDLGGGADILQKHGPGPKGKKGMIVDFGLTNVTEALAAGTNTPRVRIGTIADDDAYIDDFDFGALAVNSGGKTLKSTYHPTDAARATIVLNDTLPADTPWMVTWVAGTGAGLTGQAQGYVDVIWAD